MLQESDFFHAIFELNGYVTFNQLMSTQMVRTKNQKSSENRAFLSCRGDDNASLFGGKYCLEDWVEPVFSNVQRTEGEFYSDWLWTKRKQSSLEWIAEADRNADMMIGILMCCTKKLSKWCTEMCTKRCVVDFQSKYVHSIRIAFPPCWWKATKVRHTQTEILETLHVESEELLQNSHKSGEMLISVTLDNWQIGISLKPKRKFVKMLMDWNEKKLRNSRMCSNMKISTLARNSIVKKLCECIIQHKHRFDLKEIESYMHAENDNIRKIFHVIAASIRESAIIGLERHTSCVNQKWRETSILCIQSLNAHLMFACSGAHTVNLEATESLMKATVHAEPTSRLITLAYMDRIHMTPKEWIEHVGPSNISNIEIAVKRFAYKYTRAFGKVKHEDVNAQILNLSSGALWQCGFGAFRNWFLFLNKFENTMTSLDDGMMGILIHMTKNAFSESNDSCVYKHNDDHLYEKKYYQEVKDMIKLKMN
jgi:hypothetical protein